MVERMYWIETDTPLQGAFDQLAKSFVAEMRKPHYNMRAAGGCGDLDIGAEMTPQGGTFSGPIDISMTDAEPGADIRYTLDGSAPGPSDMRYEKPIKLEGPAVLRARAYKQGFTRSITAQEVFIIGK